MADPIHISQVPVDVDPAENGTVTNPFDKKVILGYNGRKYLFKPKESRGFNLPICLHFANHLAQMVVIEEHEQKIVKMATKKAVALDGSKVEQVDEELLMKLRKEPIPSFRDAVWKKIKSLVKTDSDFFRDKSAQIKATGKGDIIGEFDENEELL